MARQCVSARGRVYRARKNVLLNILRRGLPRAVVEFLERLAEGRRRVEVWICESED